jgi:hypothetical protein
MKLRNTLARALALVVLATPAAVAVAGPSSPANAATTTLATTATISIYNARTVSYGEQVLVEGAIRDSAGNSVNYGTVQLQASTDSVNWTTITSDTASAYLSFEVTPSVSTSYRLVYGGYTSTSSYQSSYTASTSVPVGQPVARKSVIKYRGLHMWGKVSPAKRLKLKFKIYKHHHFRPWFTVKTTARGTWSKHVRGKVGTRFLVVVPGSGGFVGTADAYHII